MRCAQPGLAALDLASGLARARKGLQSQFCPTPYALPSSRSLLGSFVLAAVLLSLKCVCLFSFSCSKDPSRPKVPQPQMPFYCHGHL